jgi:hypothetical protein
MEGGREGGSLRKGGKREEDFNQNVWLYGVDGKEILKLS